MPWYRIDGWIGSGSAREPYAVAIEAKTPGEAQGKFEKLPYTSGGRARMLRKSEVDGLFGAPDDAKHYKDGVGYFIEISPDAKPAAKQL